jgi:YVTN family beta-propeller protein
MKNNKGVFFSNHDNFVSNRKNFIFLSIIIPILLSAQWVETTIPVGSGPIALVYNPINNKVYCANNGNHNVTIINGLLNSVIRTVATGYNPSAILFNPANNKVYCANQTSNTVTVIDGVTDSVIKQIAVGAQPHKLIYTSYNNKIYCANSYDLNVSVIDGFTDSVIKTLPIGTGWRSGPSAFAYNNINNKIYISYWEGYHSPHPGKVAIFDCITDSLITTAAVGEVPQALVYDSTDNKIFCANNWSNTVTIIDGIIDMPVGMVPVGYDPYALEFNPINNKIYCANSRFSYPGYDGSVTIINGLTNALITTIPTRGHPCALLHNPANNKVYCACQTANMVQIIDGANNQISETISVGTNPTAFAYNPTQNRVYVANNGNATVSVIRDSIIGVEEVITNCKLKVENLSVYPNPAKSFFIIRSPLNAQSSMLRMYDVSGKIIREIEFKKPEVKVSLQGIKPGIYIIRMNNQLASSKLIIMQ